MILLCAPSGKISAGEKGRRKIHRRDKHAQYRDTGAEIAEEEETFLAFSVFPLLFSPRWVFLGLTQRHAGWNEMSCASILVGSVNRQALLR